MLGTLWTIILIIVAIIIIVVLVQFLMGVLFLAPIGTEYLNVDIHGLGNVNPSVQTH